MSCKHFLVYDRDGLISSDTAGLHVCTECGLVTNLPMEIEIAKEDDRYVGPDHPDFPLMLTEAKFAMERAIVRFEGRWSTGGSCTPITEPPSEPIPAPEWKREGTVLKLSPWRRFLRWIGWAK